MSSCFSSKVIWITGASSGIGEALVHQFAKAKAKIILSARTESKLQKVAHEAGLSKEDFLILPFDLNDISKAEDFVKQALAKFSRIDILINNGGISQRSLALETSEETERKLMEVNYFSYVKLTKAVLLFMTGQKSGHIVVISSIVGKFGYYLRSSYSASKHALHGYFESLRLENEENHIKVLIVCPGKIDTEVSLHALGGNGKENNKQEQSHIEGMKAAECAKHILRAIERNKKEVFIGGREIRAVWLKKWFPGLFYKVIRKQKGIN